MSPTAEPAVMSGKTRVLGGVTVIDTPLITRALDYARVHSEPFLFNHAVRSWLFAVRLGPLEGLPHDAEVVAATSAWGTRAERSAVMSWATNCPKKGQPAAPRASSAPCSANGAPSQPPLASQRGEQVLLDLEGR
jgi:hypothetical protein